MHRHARPSNWQEVTVNCHCCQSEVFLELDLYRCREISVTDELNIGFLLYPQLDLTGAAQVCPARKRIGLQFVRDNPAGHNGAEEVAR